MRGVVVVSSVIGILAVLTTNARAATTSTSTPPSCTTTQKLVIDENGNYKCVEAPVTGSTTMRLMTGSSAGSTIHGVPQVIAYNPKDKTWDLWMLSSYTTKYGEYSLAITDIDCGLATGKLYSFAYEDIDGNGVEDLILGDPKASDYTTYAGGVAIFFNEKSWETIRTGDDYDAFIRGKTKNEYLGADVVGNGKGLVGVYDGKLQAKWVIGGFDADTAPDYFGETGTTAVKPETIKLGL